MIATTAAGNRDTPQRDDAFGTRVADLAWIDEWAANVRPYVRVRVEDGVLIKLPMEVHKINAAGLKWLQRVLGGTPLATLAAEHELATHPERVVQIHRFFCDVRDLLANRLGDGSGRTATRVTRFEGSFTTYPVLSELALTYRCNQACSFCYAGCGTADAKPGNGPRERHPRRFGRDLRPAPTRDPIKDELTTAEARTVIDEIALVGRVPSISFTGGEATLRPDLPELVAHARSRKMRVNLITNGVRCADRSYVDELAAAGLTSAQVSIAGPTAAVHESLAQRPGAFAKAMQGIRNLRAAGLHVHTNTTICNENVDHLLGMVDLARDLELPHLSMNHIIPTGTPNLARHAHIRISYTRIGEHILRVKRHAETRGIDFHWYSPTPFCIFNPIAHGLGNKGCAACDGLLHVSPSGEVLPCSSFAGGVGNLLAEGFDAVWFGPAAQWYKRKRMAHPLCRTCPHFTLCQGACTLYWSALGYRELHRAYARLQWQRLHHQPAAATSEDRHGRPCPARS